MNVTKNREYLNRKGVTAKVVWNEVLGWFDSEDVMDPATDADPDFYLTVTAAVAAKDAKAVLVLADRAEELGADSEACAFIRESINRFCI